ncbi:MAG: ribosome-associated translation inhibitor RaiA [bacterium]|nr:ribosome-associated translation inhibitor RaiA [bacterium]
MIVSLNKEYDKIPESDTMKILVRSHHIDITEAIKQYAEKKIIKLTQYFDNILDIYIEFEKIESSDESKRQIVFVTVNVPGSTIRAKESSKDLYAAIDLVYEKLSVQLKKFKEKMIDSKKDPYKRSLQGPAKKSASTKKSSPVEDKLYIAKPMEQEDAILLFEELKQPFLVFRNSKTENINVIYRNKDKEIDVIET